jgi:hypothetical protein
VNVQLHHVMKSQRPSASRSQVGPSPTFVIQDLSLPACPSSYIQPSLTVCGTEPPPFGSHDNTDTFHCQHHPQDYPPTKLHHVRRQPLEVPQAGMDAQRLVPQRGRLHGRRSGAFFPRYHHPSLYPSLSLTLSCLS